MFGLLRLIFLLPLAFLAGMLWERNRVSDLCDRVGGEVIADVCTPGAAT